MSDLKCRFSNCEWRGKEASIFRHVEQYHKKYLREPSGKNYFDFCFSDFQESTFALVSTDGLYWFCQNSKADNISNALVFGIFHIGQSECTEYTLKFGLRRDGYYEYWRPFKTQPERNGNYEISFHYLQLEQFNRKIPSRKLRIYFGKFDDSDDKKWTSPFDWENMNIDDRLMTFNWKELFCIVCDEFIRKDVRFCESKHYICLQCLDTIRAERKLKCPVCRGIYEFDCSNDKLENLLRFLKWPDNNS